TFGVTFVDTDGIGQMQHKAYFN
ncbi:hypothetical protein SOVF_113430, partial [Spinacia oleracea]